MANYNYKLSIFSYDMKIKFSLFIILVLQSLFGTSLAQTTQLATSTSGSFQVTSDRGGFSANFPSEPKIKKFVSYSGNFQSPTEKYILDRNGNKLEIFMFVAEGGYDIKEAKKDFIGEVTEAIGSRGKVESNQSVDKGGCKGLEVSGTTFSNEYLSRRIFSSGQRVFVITVDTFTNTEESRIEARKFIESFTIQDNCQAPEVPAEKRSKDEKTSSVKGVDEKGSDWKRFSLGSDGISVLLPQYVGLKERSLQIFPFPLNFKVFSSNKLNASFTIAVSGDYPSDLLATEDARVNMIESMEKVLVVNGLQKEYPNVSFIDKLRLNGFPARRYSFTRPGYLGGQLILLVTPHNTYQFIAVQRFGKDTGNTGTIDKMNIEKFISSVK